MPISVAVAANNKYMHSYASGIIDSTDCYTAEDDTLNPINNYVLLVGYGYDEATGLDYWLVKNSWGTTWGDKGYVKLAMNGSCQNGTLGIRRCPMMFFTN